MRDLEPIADVSAPFKMRGTRPDVITVGSATRGDNRSDRMRGHARARRLVGAIAVGLLASACATTPKSSPINTAAATPTSSLASGAAISTAVRQSAQVLGTGPIPLHRGRTLGLVQLG